MSDIDTVLVASLKALDPERPIREADIRQREWHVRYVPVADIAHVNAITPHTARSPNLNELLQLCCRVDAAENVNRLREIALA